MHIEPGVVDGAKMVFAYGTAAAAAGYSVKLIADDLAGHNIASFAVRTVLATIGVFMFFELLPHFAVGVSEVHFILGTTLFLLLGAAPSAIGLAAGLLVQGMFFAPTDLPMYFVNVTTLLVPLFAIDALARRVIPQDRAYVDLAYADVFKLSVAYQGGVVAWVAFWAFYGQGFGADNLNAVWTFGTAYMLVVVIEPIADLAVLAGAKALRGGGIRGLFTHRLYSAG
ncbi:Cobalt uptake substrate-specific transmembrane region [Roseovarius nanhaiticus]|uniref:Cobalt uptake substrate-specific transmembrane region n=1 Tax=Roseovarius nanhaiticus TaxID=573024 RepID=A0A1N7HNC5_9RHOB|nr:energy-coupling factor ABC transporter permease [Roseovarius nanhaiticus]SEL37738.1 Cobalt uptake substrate-specific transmembrane region [Roseovarius nanhaiticus]SIS26385.1 Cobalt uptake substrate-specific transmembrane region [Roseovarius nanhaiticus]